MDLYEGMMTLKSVRRYTDEPVTDEEIMHCLRAAVQAPNGANVQPWQWLVVTDPDRKQRIGDIYRRAWARYWPAVQRAVASPQSPSRSAMHLAEHMGEAPALVMLMGPAISKTSQLRDDRGSVDIGSTYYTSLVPALQNFMLAARDLGIGTCLTTIFRIYQNEVRAVCGIPCEYEIEALVPMGRPRGKFGVAPRKPVEWVTSWNVFGECRDVDNPPALLRRAAARTGDARA